MKAPDMVINDQWRALSDQFINEELMEQLLFALLRQDDPLSVAGQVTMDELRCRIRGGFNAGIRVARLPSSM